MELGVAPPPLPPASEFDAPPARRVAVDDKPTGSKAKYHW
jgi:hypothetical protein